MAKLYSDANGVILKFVKTPEEDDQYPDTPSGTTETLAFDLRTNSAIGAALDTDWNNCRLLNGLFSYKGVFQVVNAPAGASTEYQLLKAILAKLNQDQALSAAEIRGLLRFIFKRLSQ
jgi:hypothetical protein